MSELPRKSPPRRVRRAPRFSAFQLTGGLAVLVLGLLLSSSGPVDSRYDASAAAGFLGLIFAGLGALAGGLVAVLLDRRT